MLWPFPRHKGRVKTATRLSLSGESSAARELNLGLCPDRHRPARPKQLKRIKRSKRTQNRGVGGMRGVFAGLVLAIATLGGVSSASAQFRIAEDRGGQIGPYLQQFAMVRDS